MGLRGPFDLEARSLRLRSGQAGSLPTVPDWSDAETRGAKGEESPPVLNGGRTGQTGILANCGTMVGWERVPSFP